VDAYHGNAVIEFENSLKATRGHALDQLREYTSGLWNAEGKGRRRPLVCIASDGITWENYRPTANSMKARVTPEDVELQELRVLALTEESLADFWLWLTSLLFRPSRTEPSIERFRVDFGATSPAFADALECLSHAWAVVGDSAEPRLAFETWQRYLTVTYGQLADQKSDDLLRLFLKHTYLDEEAALILRQAARSQDPVRRWLPLLCAYSGARISEVCQLRGEDITQLSGLWFMKFDPAAGALKN
jgi:hypothetical protein